MICVWETVSNAFAKSRNVIVSSFPDVFASLMISSSRKLFSSQPDAWIKPLCLSLIDIALDILSASIFVYSLNTIEPIVKGLQLLISFKFAVV